MREIVFASRELRLPAVAFHRSLEQVVKVATLQAIDVASFAMRDVH